LIPDTRVKFGDVAGCDGAKIDTMMQKEFGVKVGPF